MTTEKLKKLYEHPMFHGIKTEAEAYDICKAEFEQFGKPECPVVCEFGKLHLGVNSRYIWFLLDNDDKLSSVIYRYCDSLPLVHWYQVANDFDFENYNARNFYFLHGVERRNPHKLSEMARATILDNCHLKVKTYCNDCLRCCGLRIMIDQLEIPATEKVEIKKLIHLL